MGEKETMDGGAVDRTRTGNLVSLDDKEGTAQRSPGEPANAAAEKSVQWEPHKSPGLDTPEQERSAGAGGSSPQGEDVNPSEGTAKNAMQGNTGSR